MKAVSLNSLVRGKGPLTQKQLKQARRWVDADWESHDIDRDAVKLIDRLLKTIDDHAEATLALLPTTPTPKDYRPIQERIKEALQALPMRMSDIYKMLGTEHTTSVRYKVDDIVWDMMRNGDIIIDPASWMRWAGKPGVPNMPKIPGRYCQASDHAPGSEPDAVKRICYDSNPYENDKYMYVCAKHLGLEEK